MSSTRWRWGRWPTARGGWPRWALGGGGDGQAGEVAVEAGEAVARGGRPPPRRRGGWRHRRWPRGPHPRPAAPGGGAPARWPEPWRCAARRRTMRCGAPTGPRTGGGRRATSGPLRRRGRRCPRPGRAPSATARARRSGGGRLGARESTWRVAPASAPSSSRCWRSTRSARRPSSPPVAARSRSGRRESSRTTAGKRPLGQAEDDHEVEVEADAHGHRADEHAVAEPADPTEVALQLELQRAGEHVQADRALDGVEGAEPIERPLHPLGGLALDVGPGGAPRGAVRAARRPSAGPRLGARSNARGGLGAGQVVDHVEDEAAKVVRAAAVARARPAAHSGSSSSSSSCWARSWSCWASWRRWCPSRRGRPPPPPRGRSAPRPWPAPDGRRRAWAPP